jgi:hypothetical protein
MRYFDLFFVALVCVVSSCSSKLDLIDPNESLPVVYFQMNPDDSIFYLTLTRTFSGESSAVELARDADRVFYDSADIRLEGWADDFKVIEIQFKPSDRAKIPGIFAEGPGYCYEAQNLPLLFDNTTINSYRLVINSPGMENPVISRISVLPPTRVPNRFSHVIDLYPNGYKYPPKGNSASDLKDLQLDEEFGGIVYKQLVCEFHYQEWEGIWVDRVKTFTLRQNTLVVEPILFADFFFEKLGSNFRPINDTVTRKFISLDLVFLSGDQHYKDYFNSYTHDGNQDVPLKGNIINGYGLFTMIRVARYKDMTLGQQSHDSLAKGRLTRMLRFVSW